MIDAWMEWKRGSLFFAKLDTDFNGTPDVFQVFKNGVVILATWRPNGSKKVVRMELYRHGVKIQEFIDQDGNGLPDTRRVSDGLGREIKDEKIEEGVEWKKLATDFLSPDERMLSGFSESETIENGRSAN
jgi:hypothetical protein